MEGLGHVVLTLWVVAGFVWLGLDDDVFMRFWKVLVFLFGWEGASARLAGFHGEGKG